MLSVLDVFLYKKEHIFVACTLYSGVHICQYSEQLDKNSP